MPNSCKSIVDMKRLKQFASEKLSHQMILRDLILNEKDFMPSTEFLVKLQIWLTLLKREGK